MEPKDLRTQIDNKLIRRLRILYVIALLMIIIVIYRIVMEDLSLWWSLLAFASGIVIGLVAGRMYHLAWDESANAVVSTIDITGGIILGLYLIFSLAKRRVIGNWADDSHSALTLSLAISAGVMIGRVLFLWRGILILIPSDLLRRSTSDRE